MTNVKIYFAGEDGMITDEISSGELEKYLKSGFDIGNLNFLKINNVNDAILQINTKKGKNRRKSIVSNYIKGVKTIGDAIEYHRKETGKELVVYITERTERVAENFGVLIK
ncbi:MAG: hypothetical protein WA139_03575 [Candidatus Aenigmatarchaeota archaeon]